MIGLCDEPQCLCKQIKTPEPPPSAPPSGTAPCWMTDHELRWALRDGISVMYGHLGLKEEEE